MTTGLQAHDPSGRCAVLRILDAATSSAAPTIVDPSNQKGHPTSGAGVLIPRKPGRWKPPRDATLALYNTAGGGTISLSYLRLRVWSAAIGRWIPLGAGADASKGKINVANGYVFGEVGTDLILHTELIRFPGHFDAIHAELGTVGGSGTAFTLDLLIPIYQDGE